MTASRRPATVAAIAFACTALAMARAPGTAEAFNPLGTVCGLGGLVSGAVGKACSLGGKLLGAGQKVLGGGSSGTSTRAQAVVGLAAIGAWVLVGAKVALRETVKVIAHTTAPHLATTWFSSTYWRMAAIGAILTMPFLFAAAVQALLRSDVALALRAALGYLPLSLLAVAIAAPIATLLLAATDQMCAVVSAAAGDAGQRFLSHAGVIAGGLSIVAGSPFLAFLAGLVAAFGALVLWFELLMREAAVYIVVLMLPLAFAAFVWPARRIWAIRAVELLVALILSKFAIVAVLSLGGAALGQSPLGGVSRMLAGGVLVILGSFAPWALLRLLPLAELASGAAGALRRDSWQAGRALALAGEGAAAASGGSGEHPGVEALGDGAHEAARAHTERLSELAAGSPGEPESGDGPESEPPPPEPPQPELEPPPPEPPPEPEQGERASGAAQAPSERLPGLGPEFQMEDFSWRLHLGLEQGWPPPPLSRTDQPSDDGPFPPSPEPEDGRL